MSLHEKMGLAVEVIRGRLPEESRLDVEIDDVVRSIWIDGFTIPPAARGCGTAVMAAIVEACDEHGFDLHFVAEPSGREDDPELLDLVNWYRRLGVSIVQVFPGHVEMARPARHSFFPTDGIMDRYRAAKAHDLTSEDLDDLENQSPTI